MVTSGLERYEPDLAKKPRSSSFVYPHCFLILSSLKEGKKEQRDRRDRIGRKTDIRIVQQHQRQLVAEGVVVYDVGPGFIGKPEAQRSQVSVRVGQYGGDFILDLFVEGGEHFPEVLVGQAAEFAQRALAAELDDVDAFAGLGEKVEVDGRLWILDILV